MNLSPGRKYFSNFSWLVGVRVTQLSVSALVAAYVARYLGPSDYGLLAYALSYAAIFGAISTLGVDVVAVRHLVEEPSKEREILGTAFVLRVIGTVSMWVLIAVSLLLVPEARNSWLLVVLVSFAFAFRAFTVIDWFYQSRVESKTLVPAYLAATAVSAALKLVFVQMRVSVTWFASVAILDAATLALGMVATYRLKSKRRLRWTFDFRRAHQILRDSWPILIYSFLVVANMQIDRIMLGSLADPASVGIYASATAISALWYFIPMAAGSTFFPYIVEHSRSENDPRVKALFSVLFYLSLGGAIVTVVAAPAIIGILFGPEFSPAAAVLSIHIFSGVFVFHVSLRTRVLIAGNQQRLSTWIMLGGLLVNVIGNALLIPKYGVLGAAWASTISWAVNVLLLPLVFSRTRRFPLVFLAPSLRGVREIR